MTERAQAEKPQPEENSSEANVEQASAGGETTVKPLPVEPSAGAPAVEMPPPPPRNDKVAKTLKENSFIFGDMLKKLDPVVAKTRIDMDACIRIVGRLMGDKEAAIKSKKEVKRSAPGEFELPKEHIPPDRCKTASPCAVPWEAMSGSDRLRLCSQCQSFVYDFSGLELPEAEKLVFQRESKEVPFFYERQDGRFLSRDCPVGLASKKAKMTTLVIAAAGAVIILIVLLLIPLMAPPPKPQETPLESTQPPPVTTPGSAHLAGSSASPGATTSSPAASPWSSNAGQPASRAGAEPGQYNPDMQTPSPEPGFVPSPDAADVSVPQTGLENAPAPATSEPAQAVPAQPNGSQMPYGSDQNNPAPASGSVTPSQPNGVWQAPR